MEGNSYIGTNADGKLKSVDLASKEIKTLTSFGPGIIDGLCAVGGGTFIVSHNEGRLFRVSREGWWPGSWILR